MTPVLLLAALLMPQVDPQTARMEIRRLQAAALQRERQGQPVDWTSVGGAIAARARDAVQGVQLSQIAPEHADAWAELFEAAGLPREALQASERVPPTADPDRLTQSRLIGLRSAIQIGEPRSVRRFADAFVPGANDATRQFAQALAGAGADAVADADGPDAAQRMLEGAESRLPASGNPRPPLDSARALLAGRRADLLLELGRGPDALRVIDLSLTRIAPTSPGAGALRAQRVRVNLLGQPAPALVPETTLGEFTNLGAWRGQPILIVFFAPWSEASRPVVERVAQLQTEFGQKGLRTLGATLFYGYFGQENRARRDMPRETEAQRLTAWLTERQWSAPAVFLPRSAYPLWGVSSLPQAVLIDRDGVVRHVAVGNSARTTNQLRRAVEAALPQ